MSPKIISRLYLLLSLPVCVILTGCFTGIEGTKKITMSKEDIRRAALSPEELLLTDITPSPLGEWKPGKRFRVADSKVALAFRPAPAKNPRKYDVIRFSHISSSVEPDGSSATVISFSDSEDSYFLPIKMDTTKAKSDFNSAKLPLLIDLDMVEAVGKRLTGKTLWTKTNLSYDSKENLIRGKKFYPVKIDSVTTGDHRFPMKVYFHEEVPGAVSQFVFMNFSTAGVDSRSFDNIFSLSDLRNTYPHISDEVWTLVTREKVAVGMTKEECRLSLGKPIDVSSGHDHSTLLEIWKYPDGSYLSFADGILVNFRR